MAQSEQVTERTGPVRPADASCRRAVVLVVVIALITEIVTFEYTLVSPALPNIAAAFHTTQPGLVITTTMLVAGVTAPVLAKLADIHGKKKLLLCGAASFMVGSFACAIAPTFPVLLVGRGLQGVAVVGVVVSIGLIRDLLPPRYVPVAIGAIGVGTGTGSILGPLLGGWFIDNLGFRACFWFLLAYMAVAAAIVATIVPETPVRIRHRLDLLGAVLLGLGVGALIVAAVRPDLRVPSAVAGVVMLVGFVQAERRTSEPLMSMTLLARPAVWTTLVAALFIGVISGATSVLFPQLLRSPAQPGESGSGMGFDAVEFALYYGLPQGIAGCACGFVAGWISRRHAPRTALIVAAGLLTCAVSLTAAGLADSHGMVVLVGALMGAGIGMYYSGSANLIVEAVPANTQSVSQSMKNTAEAVAGSFASAAVGAILAAHVLTVDPTTRQAVFSTSGFHTAFLLCSASGVLALLVAVAMRTGRTPATGGVAPGTE